MHKLLKQFDQLIILLDLLDQRYCQLNDHVKEVSKKKRNKNKFEVRKYLLEDNQEQYQPFEDDLIHKLIQMEENKFR